MIYTSEQVSEGHPDKICDAISDAILTAFLREDKNSRVAVETLIKDNSVMVAGEVTSKAKINVEKIIFQVLEKIGVENPKHYLIYNFIVEQSKDIALGVNIGGAGDQGMVYGYSTNETDELLPIPYVLATKILLELKKIVGDEIKPDAKAQVSYDYDKERIDTILVSSQHSEKINQEKVINIIEPIIRKVTKDYNQDFRLLINPTGRFVEGGSFADCGLTGRKIVADTYGSLARHGGGAFSGKDPTKVDRSGAYMARKIANDIVKKKMADKIEIQIAYAIGVSEPVSLAFDCFNTEKVDKDKIMDFIKSYDLRPKAIIERLNLLDFDYNQVSSYGHFGKPMLPWEI